jgi:hypothetical protein
MFEKADRLKLRFESSRGSLTKEDLWDLPLIKGDLCLDNLAKALNKAVKENEEESFVVKKSNANEVLGLKFDIVKHIIKVKLDEAEQNEKKVENKARKDTILEIMHKKKNAELEDKSTEELEKELEKLG